MTAGTAAANAGRSSTPEGSAAVAHATVDWLAQLVRQQLQLWAGHHNQHSVMIKSSSSSSILIQRPTAVPHPVLSSVLRLLLCLLPDRALCFMP
jgi:hypothetical protein